MPPIAIRAGFLLAWVLSLAPVRFAWAAPDLPKFPGATDITRKAYQHDHFPQGWQPINAVLATVVVYHLPLKVDPEKIADFYAKTLEKSGWTRGLVKIVDSERYAVFNQTLQQAIIHIKPEELWLAVDTLLLEFPTPPDAPGGEANVGEQHYAQTADEVPAGATVHVVCPSGRVRIRTRRGSQAQVEIRARAAVDYPSLASSVLQSIRPALERGEGEVTFGIDLGTAKGTSAHLTYDFDVIVPEDVNVQVEIKKATEASFGLPAGGDGNVDVKGPITDVDITTSGPISVDSASGKVSAITSYDPIWLNNLSGPIVARTTGMWIKASNIKLASSVDLETTEAQVEVRLSSIDDGGQLTIKTTRAAIRVVVPADASLDLTAIGKECTAPVPMDPVESPGLTPRHHGVMNGGKVPLELQTSGGGAVYIQNK